jgi:Domain of unknown function (DUF4338)
LWYVSGVADESTELKVRLITEAETGWYNALMAEHHSLGVAASGRVLRYVAEADGVPAVLGTFGSAAWRCAPRDELFGWDAGQRAARLERVAGNQRLCVLVVVEYWAAGLTGGFDTDMIGTRVSRWPTGCW